MFEKDSRQFGVEDLEMKTTDKSLSINLEQQLRGDTSGNIQIISSIGGDGDSNLVHMKDVVKQSTMVENNNHHHLHHYRSFSSSSLLDKQPNQQQIIRLHQLQTQQEQFQHHKPNNTNLFAPSMLSMPKIKS